jgi:hypothetical protein
MIADAIFYDFQVVLCLVADRHPSRTGLLELFAKILLSIGATLGCVVICSYFL